MIEASGGLRVPFRYYFCQREAMETLIYLYEAVSYTHLDVYKRQPIST